MDEIRFLLEFKSLHKSMNSLCAETISSISLFNSDPLFSCIVTFCTLILLYLPHQFWKIVFSPVLVLTGILLLAVLRLGATQKSQHEKKENQDKSEPIKNRASKEEKQSSSPIEPKEVQEWINSCSGLETEFNSQMGFDSSSCFVESFVEWNVKAPLEVIYEEYEGEEEEAGEDSNEKEKNRNMGFSRYPSLSRYYPESESDSDSSSEKGFPAIGDWDSPENICFRWDEEDREELIEIALDGCKKRALEFHFEEENLIEIDISPTRYKEFSGEDEAFSGEISCN